MDSVFVGLLKDELYKKAGVTVDQKIDEFMKTKEFDRLLKERLAYAVEEVFTGWINYEEVFCDAFHDSGMEKKITKAIISHMKKMEI
jgi:hypothetical protein